MTNWEQYWRENTPEMNRRVSNIKNMLKTSTPVGPHFTRFGSPTDGGYILSDDLDNNDILISMGVEQNVDFELHLSKIVKESYLFDYSVDGTPVPVPNSHFYKWRIGAGPDAASLHDCLGMVPLYVEKKDYILKIDIEGSEFETIAAASTETLGDFRQITVEVHWMQNLWNDEFYNTALAAFTNLRKTHTPVLVHANNNVPLMVMGNSPVPMVFEVLYLRTDDYVWREEHDPFEGLIVKNDPHFPEIGLTFP